MAVPIRQATRPEDGTQLLRAHNALVRERATREQAIDDVIAYINSLD